MKLFHFAALLIAFTASSKFAKAEAENIKVCFDAPAGWYYDTYAYVYRMDGWTVHESRTWPGLQMTKEGTVYCRSFSEEYDGGYIIFNDNVNQVPAFPERGFNITADALYDVNGYKSSIDEIEPPKQTEPMTINVKLYTEWEEAFAYIHSIYKGSGSWAYDNGVSMSNCEGEEKCKTITIHTPNTVQEIGLAFNDGISGWDSGYHITESGDYTIVDGNLTKAN